MPTKADNTSKTTITVDVAFRDYPVGKELPHTRAYLFDSAGRLAESKPVHKEPVKFEVAAGQRYQVKVGPDLLHNKKEHPADLVGQLTRAKALTQDYVPALGVDKLSFAAFPTIYGCWFETCIFVHGTVRKLLNPGSNQPLYAPICTGTVQIFQVDLECTLDTLAPVYLLTLRDSLVGRLTGSAEQSRVSLSAATSRSTAASLATIASSSATSRAFSTTSSLSEVATTLSVLEGGALKQYIVANKAILYDFWCELIPDSAFCWQELTEVLIQSDGSFSAEICFWCPEDFPDLYFEVIQNLYGTEVEISDPQIACSTYYNYDGSQSVDIVVDDPDAVSCPPVNPGPNYLYVWPNYIGWEDLWYVQGLTNGVGPGLGLLPGKTPWGGTLQLKVQFHPDLPTPPTPGTPGISYYRWSYQFQGDPSFTQINAPSTIRYQTVTYVPPSTVIIVNTPVTFTPQTLGGNSNLFAIPQHGFDWIDFPYGNFDSTEGTTPRRSGLCTLRLEMFDNAGNPVASDNLGGPSTFAYLLADQSVPLGTYTNVGAYNIDASGNLIFQILVDNNDTVAQVTKVSTPLDSTDTDPCGILHYTNSTDTVTIYYVAFHPNNFLDWSLGVSLGIKGQVAGLAGIHGLTDTSAGAPSPGSPATFVNSAGTLLGTCTEGAFAVLVYCAARAVDGYSRQSQYDRQFNAGFALIEPCPPCPPFPPLIK